MYTEYITYDEEIFKRKYFTQYRGRPIFLVYFKDITGINIDAFAKFLSQEIHCLLDNINIEFGFLVKSKEIELFLSVIPFHDNFANNYPNIDNAIGKFLFNCEKTKNISFKYGIGRTSCNFVSDSDEIYNELVILAKQNLEDNIIRWKWTFLNKANMFLANSTKDAKIQPTFYYDVNKKAFYVKGGEVFLGGDTFSSYHDLIKDLPKDQNLNRFELLILEKLIIATQECPGILKFNISPQSFIEIFKDPKKVKRFYGLVKDLNKEPSDIRFELVEKPFEEVDIKLKDVCKMFWDYGFTFAADDFGVKSQSHQVVLELGIMIKEFKLDPLSFQFREDKDQIKFLDNLAFIDYCQHLANNRDAIITAESVNDLSSLEFLIEHKVYHFQTNLLAEKILIEDYIQLFLANKELSYIELKEYYFKENIKTNIFLKTLQS